jgi:hypothetical protein
MRVPSILEPEAPAGGKGLAVLSAWDYASFDSIRHLTSDPTTYGGQPQLLGGKPESAAVGGCNISLDLPADCAPD